MKTLSFCYSLTAEYSQPVRRHSWAFSFLPTGTCRQNLQSLDLSGCPGFRESEGLFGGRRLLGCLDEPHTAFGLQVRGRVKTGLDIYEARCDDPLDAALFRAQTDLTAPGEAIRAYHASLGLTGSTYDKVLKLRDRLHADYRYQPGLTAVHEPAETAFAHGHGVCQDYAHIMLALLRMEGIPARYVTGMTLGEGASHAWVEALCGEYWYGIDPTNGLLVDDTYIRACCGRDSADCSVIRGTFLGQALQTQREHVTVAVAENTEENV